MGVGVGMHLGGLVVLGWMTQKILCLCAHVCVRVCLCVHVMGTCKMLTDQTGSRLVPQYSTLTVFNI